MVYVAARNLVPGTLLFTSKGSPVTVKSIKEIKKRTTVCGITVADNHNYFVGKSSVLVHNDCRVRFANGKEKVIKFDDIAQLVKDGENFQIIDANVAAPNNPNNPLNQAWDKAKNGQFNPEGLTYSDAQWLEFINSAGGRDFLNKYQEFAIDTNTSAAIAVLGSSTVNFIHWAGEKLNLSRPNTGYTYDPRVRQRALEDPVSHNFPYSFDSHILSTNPIPKRNGYTMYQLQGTMNGKKGVFEIGVTKDKIIDHRFFRPTK